MDYIKRIRKTVTKDTTDNYREAAVRIASHPTPYRYGRLRSISPSTAEGVRISRKRTSPSPPPSGAQTRSRSRDYVVTEHLQPVRREYRQHSKSKHAIPNEVFAERSHSARRDHYESSHAEARLPPLQRFHMQNYYRHTGTQHTREDRQNAPKVHFVEGRMHPGDDLLNPRLHSPPPRNDRYRTGGDATYSSYSDHDAPRK